MSTKDRLMNKLFQQPIPKNFTKQELDSLMKKCNCVCYSGGRGSALKYFHSDSGRILTFDGPHPGNELYIYQIKMVKKFLIDIGETDDGKE